MADLVPDTGSIKPPPGGGPVPDEGSIQGPEEPGRLEALGRGALQGVTFGFADEAQGALESIFTDKTYQAARDQARQANARAHAAHSGFYGGGEVVGGLASALVPGLGIAEGAGLAGVAGKAALAGGLGGLGGSEATDVGGVLKDVGAGALEGGIGGAVAHGAGKVAGRLLSAAPEAADAQALKALSQGEGKAGAAWSTTRKMVQDPNVREALNTPIGEEGVTLSSVASKPAEEVRPLIKTQQAKIGQGLDEIYDKADQASGGVKVSDLVKHYDDKIAELGNTPGNRGAIKALENAREDVLKSWAPRLAEALGTEEAAVPAVKAAILKQLDSQIPSKDVRAFATTLQDRAETTETNPALATQIRKELATTTRDFVNDHVANVLGDEDGAALKSLNAKMSALYNIDGVLAERADKEAAGRISGKGLANTLLGHGGLVGAGMMAMHGNLPGAAAALVLPKIIEHAPAAGRFATTQAAHANQILQQVMRAADQGSPWAQAQIRALRSSPIGAARLAQLTPTIAAPVDQQSEAP